MIINDWNRTGGIDIADDVMNSIIINENIKDKEPSKNKEGMPDLLLSFGAFSGLIYQVLFWLFFDKTIWSVSPVLYFVVWFVLSAITIVVSEWILRLVKISHDN